MAEKVLARFIIEIGGKPVENVNKALNLIEKNLKEEKKFKLLSSEIEEAEFNEEAKIYLGFLEVSIKFSEVKHILEFILDYTPSSVEIEEPENLKLNNSEFTGILNDLAANILKSNKELMQMRAYIHMLQKEQKEQKNK